MHCRMAGSGCRPRPSASYFLRIAASAFEAHSTLSVVLLMLRIPRRSGPVHCHISGTVRFSAKTPATSSKFRFFVRRNAFMFSKFAHMMIAVVSSSLGFFPGF